MKSYPTKFPVLSGSLLIAGTTVGAGMLGIPLVTADAGFFPAVFVTLLVWAFMYLTGRLFLEVTLWMPDGANILSMSQRFLGKNGQILTGITFLFLYYCLMIAYFAAGAPLLLNLLGPSFASWQGYLIFGLIFGGLVASGVKWIDRFNYLFIAIMVFSYFSLVYLGSTKIEAQYLSYQRWSLSLLAMPVLFSSFGYHNIIPSLCTYLKRDRAVLKKCLFWGTIIPLSFYLVWQLLFLGAIPLEKIQETLALGKPVTESFSFFSDSPSIHSLGRIFSFFAVITSLLGVAFSMVDFLGDGMKIKKREGWTRVLLCILIFAPPYFFSLNDPKIFIKAIGIAGGFGEAILNGFLPVVMVWVGKYRMEIQSKEGFIDQKYLLKGLFLISVFVVFCEIVNLV